VALPQRNRETVRQPNLSELCIDGTRVRANASRHKTWTADRVEKLLKELDGQIETAMAEMETNDSIDEMFDDGTSPAKLPPERDHDH